MRFTTIITEGNDGFIITLKDLTNNTFSEIYTYGALLNKFCAVANEEALNVIEGFSSLQEITKNKDPFFKSAKLSPYACRVKDATYTFGGKTYQLTKHLTNNDAIHGVLFDCPFSINESYCDDDSAIVLLEFLYNNDKEGYPFYYKCNVRYRLTSGNALSIETTVTNLDNKLMPVMDGWHPYFNLGDKIDECQLEFQSKEILEFDEHLVPTGTHIPYNEFGSLKSLGTISLDNCFTLNFSECQPLCVLRNPGKKVQMEFYPSPSYPYLQVFTPDHRKSIAIENLSAAPDAFNNGMGLKVLDPGETATFSTKFIIRFL